MQELLESPHPQTSLGIFGVDKIIINNENSRADAVEASGHADSMDSSVHHDVSCVCASCLVETHNNNIKNIYSPRGSLVRFHRKKLLILDLNGLLADINQDYHNVHKADAKVKDKLGKLDILIVETAVLLVGSTIVNHANLQFTPFTSFYKTIL